MEGNSVPLAFNNSVLNEFSRKLPQDSKWLVKRVSSNQKIRLSVGYKDTQPVIHSDADLDDFLQKFGIEISDADKRKVQLVVKELGELFNPKAPPTPPSRPAPAAAARAPAKAKAKPKAKAKAKPQASSSRDAGDAKATSKRKKPASEQPQSKSQAKAAPKPKAAPAKGRSKPVAESESSTEVEAKPETKRKRARPINAAASKHLQIEEQAVLRQIVAVAQSQPGNGRKRGASKVATIFATGGDDDDAILPGGAVPDMTAGEDEGSSDFDGDPNDAIAAFAASALAFQKSTTSKKAEVRPSDASDDAGNTKKRRRASKGAMSMSELAKTSDTYEPLLRHFQGANKGAKGIKTALRKHANRGSVVPRPVDLEAFAKQEEIAHTSRDFFQQLYEQKFEEWLWLLHCGYNVLLYGVGDKSNIIASFASNLLVGEDVIEITNRNSNGDPRSLLDFISTHILRSDFRTSNLLQYAKQVTIALARTYNSENTWLPTLSLQPASSTVESAVDSSSVTDNASERTFEGDSIWLMPSRRTRSHYRATDLAGADDAIKAKPDSRRLFLLVHDLSAPAWQSPESQLVLSTLASGRSVAIVAAFENVNLPSQWTHRMLDQFRWTFQHVPTYKHLRSSLRATSADITGGMHQQGLEFVLRSLTRRHLEILGVLSDHQLTADGVGAMPYAALFEACKKQIITQTDAQLRHFLVELRDQKLIVMSHGRDGKELVKIPLQVDSLQQIKSIVAR